MLCRYLNVVRHLLHGNGDSLLARERSNLLLSVRLQLCSTTCDKVYAFVKVDGVLVHRLAPRAIRCRAVRRLVRRGAGCRVRLGRARGGCGGGRRRRRCRCRCVRGGHGASWRQRTARFRRAARVGRVPMRAAAAGGSGSRNGGASAVPAADGGARLPTLGADGERCSRPSRGWMDGWMRWGRAGRCARLARSAVAVVRVADAESHGRSGWRSWRRRAALATTATMLLVPVGDNAEVQDIGGSLPSGTAAAASHGHHHRGNARDAAATSDAGG